LQLYVIHLQYTFNTTATHLQIFSTPLHFPRTRQCSFCPLFLTGSALLCLSFPCVCCKCVDTCPSLATQLQRTCNAPETHLQHLCKHPSPFCAPLFALPLHHTCNTPATHVKHTCNTPATHLQHTCKHLSPLCGLCVPLAHAQAPRSLSNGLSVCALLYTVSVYL